MDVEGVLEGLRLERTVAVERIARLDEAIGALERLTGQVSAKPIPPASNHSKEWAEMQQLYESGERTVVQIAQAMRVSTATVYNRKKAERWAVPSKVNLVP